MKTTLQHGGKTYGTFLTSGAWGGFLEMFAHHGYDFVVLDTEHGPIGYEKLESARRRAWSMRRPGSLSNF